MADLTISNRQDLSLGSVRGVSGNVTVASDGDTITPGLARILWAGVTTRTATAGQLVQADIDTDRTKITLKVEGGTPVLDFFAIGY